MTPLILCLMILEWARPCRIVRLLMNWKSPGSSIIFSMTSGWFEMDTKAPSAASCFGLMVVSPCSTARRI